MDYKKYFIEIMGRSRDIALATCDGQVPNVRILNFYHRENTPSMVYFVTFRDSAKVGEIGKNAKVSFTTLPTAANPMAYVRVFGGRIEAIDGFDGETQTGYFQKFPESRQWMQECNEKLFYCVIHFNEAHVDVDMQNSGMVKF